MRLLVVLCLLCVTAPGARSALAEGAGPAAARPALLEQGLGLLLRARAHYQANDFDAARREGREAERLLKILLEREPRNLQAAVLACQARTLAGDTQAAKAWIQRYYEISERGEQDPGLHYLVAFVQLIGEKRPDRAIHSLTRMYGLDPRADPIARDNLWQLALGEHGRNLMLANLHDQANVQFRIGARIARRLGRRREQLKMLSNVGITLMRASRDLEAAEVFADLAKREPDNPLWLYRRGLATANQNLFAEAAPIYRAVIRLLEAGHGPIGDAPDLGQVELRLGNCLRHLADKSMDPARAQALLGEAETHIRHYMAAAPQDPIGHYWLGVLLLEHREDPYGALGHFAKAFELDSICDGPLRYMLQIHRNFPAPAGTSAAEWAAPIEAWSKDLSEGADRRRQARDEREHRRGSDGCN